MLLVDTRAKRIISDEECKEAYASAHPYGEWLDANLVHLKDLAIPNRQVPTHTQEERDRRNKISALMDSINTSGHTLLRVATQRPGHYADGIRRDFCSRLYSTDWNQLLEVK